MWRSSALRRAIKYCRGGLKPIVNQTFSASWAYPKGCALDGPPLPLPPLLPQVDHKLVRGAILQRDPLAPLAHTPWLHESPSLTQMQLKPREVRMKRSLPSPIGSMSPFVAKILASACCAATTWYARSASRPGMQSA